MKFIFSKALLFLLSAPTISAAALGITVFYTSNALAIPCGCDSPGAPIPATVPDRPDNLCPDASKKTQFHPTRPSDGSSDTIAPILPPPGEAPYVHSGPLKLLRTIRGKDVLSPKSASFHPDGTRLYVNALEAMKTLVYDASTLQYLYAIDHRFSAAESSLFQNEENYLDYPWYHAPSKGNRNIFGGKPVEMTFSHKGKYLWIPYYRRSYDRNASCPSAISIIDTETDSIVRVMPTAPLPKMVAASPDGKHLAVVHWGDNSVGIYDISSSDPAAFVFKGIVYTGPRPDLSKISGDRDARCGQCLRGSIFTADSRYLLVGRMHNGGISVIDMESMSHAGVFTGIAPTPRHMILSKDGKTLYVSSSSSGVVSELDVDALVRAALEKTPYRGKEVRVGKQVRTIALSPDGEAIFASVNKDSLLVRIDTATLKVSGKISVPPYAVGAAVSTDGRIIVTTSQGKSGKGGHVLGVYTEVQTPQSDSGKTKAKKQ